MPDTYVARVRGFPSSPGNCILAIYSNPGSGKLVNVHDVWIESPSITNLGGIRPGCVEIRRISGLTGGDALTATKLDTSNQVIPTTVLIRENGIPTLTSDAAISQITISQMFRPVDSLSILDRHGLGISYLGLHSSLVYDNPGSTANLPITLRQNEGISLYVTATPTTMEMRYSIVFKIAGVSNETYIVEDECSFLHAGQTPFSIFNGDSSAVIEIHDIAIKQSGDYTFPLFVGVPIGGLQSQFGSTVTPIKRDSSSPNLPSGISIIQDCPVKQVGIEVGGGGMAFGAFHSRALGLTNLTPYGLLQSGMPSYFACTYTTTPSTHRPLSGPGVITNEIKPPMGPIGLYPGYGFAVVLVSEDSVLTTAVISPQYRTSMGTVEVRIVFDVSDAIVPGAAS